MPSRNYVTILWIPGHSDYEYSKREDEPARIGSETLLVGPEPVWYISYGKARTEVGTWLHKEKMIS